MLTPPDLGVEGSPHAGTLGELSKYCSSPNRAGAEAQPGRFLPVSTRHSLEDEEVIRPCSGDVNPSCQSDSRDLLSVTAVMASGPEPRLCLLFRPLPYRCGSRITSQVAKMNAGRRIRMHLLVLPYPSPRASNQCR